MPNIQGLQEFQAKLKKIESEIPGKMGKALYRYASQVKNDAVKRAPYKTGALRRSAVVDGPYKSGDTLSVNIIFGGDEAPYAIYVHENLSVHHPFGEAKFLENALNESVTTIKEELSYEIMALWTR